MKFGLPCHLVMINSQWLRTPLLPAATKLWPRLCFYRCLWFCPQGGVSGEPPPRTKETPPLRTKETPPSGPRNPPPDQADLQSGRRLQHTVNERPVRILLECNLVSDFSLARVIQPFIDHLPQNRSLNRYTVIALFIRV